MKETSTPLMALALAGILAPIAEAKVITETTDYSASSVTPTVLGVFHAEADSIHGSLFASRPVDNIDAFQVSETAERPSP